MYSRRKIKSSIGIEEQERTCNSENDKKEKQKKIRLKKTKI